PDADRLGFIERYNDNEYRYFNGNEFGILLTKLRFQDLADEGKTLYMVKSIVTSELAERLAIALDVEVKNVLTGFKYISNLLKKESSEQENQQLITVIDKHGYLANPYSTHNNVIQRFLLFIKYKYLLVIISMTYKDTMGDMYVHIGSYKDKTLSPSFEGAE